MVYQRGGQREGSPHYVFLYSDDENSGDDENIPLQSRLKETKSLPKKVEVIKVQLKPEDTLQALALRYQCTISELKRINNIHKENEIFARRAIKVPVKPYSVLTETLNEQSVTENDLIGKTEEDSVFREEKITNLHTTTIVSSTSTGEINDIILNSICEPLSLPRNSDSFELNEDENDQLLDPSECDKVSTQGQIVDTFKCSGADWGLHWTQLLCLFLLLGFAGPVIYVLYLAEHSPKPHTDDN